MSTSVVTHTSSFVDDTVFLSIHRDSTVTSQRLQSHVSESENWLQNWKIKVKVSNCLPIKINGVTVPEHNCVRYLGIDLDRCLTWVHHIAAKITQIKASLVYWT